MSRFMTVIAALLLASSSAVDGSTGSRRRRSPEAEKDLKPAETRIPILPYGGAYEPYGHGLAYGVDPYGAGIHGVGLHDPVAYGAGGLGVGAYGPGQLGLHGHRPLGVADGYGYNSGYLKAGINDGSLALGNHGAELYRGGSDGKYADGSFHEGGAVRDGGYRGLDSYKDSKHHVADDASSTGHYSGVQGSRKDLGNGEEFDKNQNYAQNAYNTLGDSELAGHKKGHHRTGFKKSYHKDESGNDESFYDSDHDEGNHALGKKYGDQYGTNAASSLSGGHAQREFDARQQGNQGYEGNGKLLSLNQGAKDYSGNNGYYNSGNKYGALGSGQSANYGKYGQQNGHLNGYSNGRNFEDFRGGKFGGGYGPGGYGPYGGY